MAVAMSLVGGLLAVVIYAVRALERPQVGSYVPVTGDGVPKNGPLLTDGHKLYFEERIKDEWTPVSVPLTGGSVAPVSVPLGAPHLLDWSNDRTSFLVGGSGTDGKAGLWEWKPGDPPILVSASPARYAKWMVGGKVASALRDNRLRIIEKGSSERTIVFPDYVECIQWSSASATLRLTMFNLKTDLRTFWDLRDVLRNPIRCRTTPATRNVAPGHRKVIFSCFKLRVRPAAISGVIGKAVGPFTGKTNRSG